LGFNLILGDRGCFSLPPKAILDSSASTSEAESSVVGRNNGGLGVGESGGLIEGIGGTDGTFVSCGNEATNGLTRENPSDNPFESLHSTGDLTATMLAGELTKEIGDEGAEDTHLITLFCGKTVIPHLLTGRMGAGVNKGCIIGEVESGGEAGWIATSTDSRWTGEEGRLSV